MDKKYLEIKEKVQACYDTIKKAKKDLDTYIWEVEAWFQGFKFAESKGIKFLKKIKQWGYRQALSYVDYK